LLLIVVNIGENSIQLLVKNPDLFKTSEHDNVSREALITKHTTMFYSVTNNTMEIEYFWGNFENPNKIKELLKIK
jgi:hypothetical protein